MFHRFGFVTIWVWSQLEFCQNLSFFMIWTLSQFRVLSHFEFCYTLTFSNQSFVTIWVLSEFRLCNKTLVTKNLVVTFFSYKMFTDIFLLLLLSAHVDRFNVACKQDSFFRNIFTTQIFLPKKFFYLSFFSHIFFFYS